MLAIEPFLHYASGVGYGSATSTPNFGMADVVVPSYFLFAFRHNRAMRTTVTNVQLQDRESFRVWGRHRYALSERIKKLTR
jgi:hypothetical protein